MRRIISAGMFSNPERWWFPGLAAVFLAAFTLRLFVLRELSSSPAWGVLFIDSELYDQWAKTLAAGDWLGKEAFYMAPLYPYFLGVVYLLLGSTLIHTLLIQAFAGSAACVFLAIAGRSFLGAGAGLVAGLLLAINPTAIFSDTLIQKSVLDVLLICLLLAALGKALDRPSSGRWFWTGLAAAGLTLTRENTIVFLPLLVSCLIIRAVGLPTRRLLSQLCAWFLGVSLALGPVVVRNWIVSGELFLTTAQFGYNFYIGNNAAADGTYSPLIPGEQGKEQQDARALAEAAVRRRLTSGQVSSYWRDRALHYIVTQPLSWFSLLGRKCLLLANALELPDSYDQYTYGDWSFSLRWLTRCFHIGVLLPLAAGGMVVSWARRQHVWPLYALLILYAGSVVAFFVLSRYRLPVVPLLILFAAAFIMAVGARWRDQKARSAVPLGTLVLVATAVFSNWPVAEAAQKPIFKSTTLNNLATILVKQPDRELDVERLLTAAIHLEPGFGPSYYYLGLAYRNLGRYPESLNAFRRAALLLPSVPDSYFEIGQVYSRMGRPAEALPWYRQALIIDPDEALWSAELSKALKAVEAQTPSGLRR